MAEVRKPWETMMGETVEQKKERLRSLFQSSQEVFRNPDRSLREGALIITQRFDSGEQVEISGLVAMEIDEDGVELGVIEDDGEIGASGFVSWEEIIDAKLAS